MSEKKRPVGRPSVFSQELIDKICELISNGMSLRAVCSQEGMPSTATVCKWLSENQEFSEQYARAREKQADYFVEEIIEIADSVEAESAAVSKAKLQIDARKWAASKIAPKKYGDKVEQQITGNLAIQADVKLSDLFLSDEE